ncbi:MAG: alanine/glycine:cation symporter family protein [Acidobacteriota bacterium]
MESLDQILSVAVDYAWGLPLIILVVGGGLFLTTFSRLLPFQGIRHAFDLLRGKHVDKDAPGEISHLQTLSTALSSTIGTGNIGGVAIAITQGGPGAVFWMWLAALVGMATKFFSCTLAVMYRRQDSRGVVQGGPMYFIEVGLGRKARFLSIFFSVCGTIGCLAMFQANQVAEVLNETYQVNPWITGWVSVVAVAIVVLGGIQRIALVASRLVPSMCVLYFISAIYVVLSHLPLVPVVLGQIVHDAFTGTAATGGALGIGFISVVQTGIKRGSFSNEAGIGTAPMAHGASRTREPVREGLVAMLGPFIDTIVICSLTAFAILVGSNWRLSNVRGASLTVESFESAMGPIGTLALVVVVVLFAFSTMFGYSYYGKKCFSYLFGAERGRLYEIFYLGMLLVGAVWKVDMVINLLDTSFAMMALPNMIATLLLAPKVMVAARGYFSRYRIGLRS